MARPKLVRPDRQSLAELAYDTIAEAIYAHRLVPGERLSIEELCRQLDMSATPVREALARAVALDLVRQDRHHGFSVAPHLSAVELSQLFAVRRRLEYEALDELAPGPPVDRIAELANSLAVGDRGPTFHDISRFSMLDHAFHREFVAAAKNRFLLHAWEGLHFHLRVHRVYGEAGIIDFSEATVEHAAIARAARTSDLGVLRAAYEEHITNSAARITDLAASLSGVDQDGS